MFLVGARVHDYGKDQPEALFQRIAADGFECVMLAFQKAILNVDSYFQVDEPLMHRTLEALRQNRLAIHTLGVYMELGMAEEAVRQAQVAQFLRGIQVAAAMKLPNVATETTAFAKQPGVTPKQAYHSLQRSLEQALPVAQAQGVNLCVEPVFYHTLSSPELAQTLLREMQSPNLKITFDPVNLLQAGEVQEQRALWRRCMDCFGEDIEVIHMKGVAFEGEKPVSVPLTQSVLDYEYVAGLLHRLNRPLHMIREGADPRTAKADVAFLKTLC